VKEKKNKKKTLKLEKALRLYQINLFLQKLQTLKHGSKIMNLVTVFLLLSVIRHLRVNRLFVCK
jgi:hypothetical protein